MRRRSPRAYARRLSNGMFGRCGLCLRQCIHVVRKRGILPGLSATGSGPLVARHRQVHAPCEAETWNSHKGRRAEQAHQCGVLGYKGARRTRLAQRKAWEADADVNRQISNDVSQEFADGGDTANPEGIRNRLIARKST